MITWFTCFSLGLVLTVKFFLLPQTQCWFNCCTNPSSRLPVLSEHVRNLIKYSDTLSDSQINTILTMLVGRHGLMVYWLNTAFDNWRGHCLVWTRQHLHCYQACRLLSWRNWYTETTYLWSMPVGNVWRQRFRRSKAMCSHNTPKDEP